MSLWPWNLSENVGKPIRFELVRPSTNTSKEWGFQLESPTRVVFFWGRIGTKSQTKLIEYARQYEAERDVEKRVAAKLREGYVRAVESTKLAGIQRAATEPLPARGGATGGLRGEPLRDPVTRKILPPRIEVGMDWGVPVSESLGAELARSIREGNEARRRMLSEEAQRAAAAFAMTGTCEHLTLRKMSGNRVGCACGAVFVISGGQVERAYVNGKLAKIEPVGGLGKRKIRFEEES